MLNDRSYAEITAMSMAYVVLGFLIILVALTYFLDRRYTHIDRHIKKKKNEAKELQRND